VGVAVVACFVGMGMGAAVFVGVRVRVVRVVVIHCVLGARRKGRKSRRMEGARCKVEGGMVMWNGGA
jgi:hypothetical protein